MKLESRTRALLAKSKALWLLALHVIFVLFFNQFTVSRCISTQRPAFSVTHTLYFSFLSASGVWLIGAECEASRGGSSGVGGTSTTSPVRSVGGIQPERHHRLKTVMLLVDSPRIQPYSGVMHSSNLCNYKQVRQKKKSSVFCFLRMSLPHSSRETFTCLSFRSWMGFNEASQMCVCGYMSVHLPSSKDHNWPSMLLSHPFSTVS